MSLLERSIAFAKDAKELAGLKKAANLVAQVTSRAQQFEAALAGLRLAGGQFALLRDKGLAVDADVTPTVGFVHHLTSLKAATAEDASAITANDIAVYTLTPLKSFTATITAACAATWRSHVRDSLPRVGADLVPVLARVPALKTRVERFRTLHALARDKAEDVPTSDADFEAFERAAAASHEAWDALDAEGIPSNVTRFLREATSEAGASLDAWSLDTWTEVRDWLHAQGLLASFAIRGR